MNTSRQAERDATRAFWNSQSNYKPKHERSVNFNLEPQVLSAHVLYDERVDHNAYRVHKAAYNPELVGHTLANAWKEITHEEKLRLKDDHPNKTKYDVAALFGHGDVSATRVKKLNPLEHNPVYGGSALPVALSVIDLPLI